MLIYTSCFSLTLPGLRKYCTIIFTQVFTLALAVLNAQTTRLPVRSMIRGWCHKSGLKHVSSPLYRVCPFHVCSSRMLFLPIKCKWPYQNLSLPLGLPELLFSDSLCTGHFWAGLASLGGQHQLSLRSTQGPPNLADDEWDASGTSELVPIWHYYWKACEECFFEIIILKCLFKKWCNGVS